MDRYQSKPGNYLVFDGGHSALSALYILEEIFERLRYDLDQDEEVSVHDHCDLFSGTNTGAVAAILLGRMGLTPSQTIDAYLKLESALSVQATKDEGERRRNTDAFKTAFTGVLEEAGFTAGTPMLDKTAPKTVIWTLNAVNLSVIQPIRSYRIRGALGPSLTILEAACASIASLDKFLPVTIGTGHKQIVLVDATAGYANPTKELLQEAQRAFNEDAEVASVVSLGSGKGEVLSVVGTGGEGALVDAMAKMALDSEQTHKEVHSRLHRSSIYFRLNVERGLVGHMDASSVRAHTTAYIQEGDNDKLLNDVVDSIKCRQKGSTLKDINSVTAVEITMKPRPSLVDNFVGREDILDALRATHFGSRSLQLNKPTISVLMGLGGSGKTQIALRFALEYEGRYREAPVYFFDARSEDKLKADFELSIRSRDSESRSKSHDDAIVWFSKRKENWLIIMDNADDPSVQLFRYIPKSSCGNIIITTRNSTYKNLAPNSSHFIEGLASSEAVELILKGASYGDNEGNRAHALRIADALGHLPLALAHAAGYISVHRCLPTYLGMFLTSRAKFLSSKPALAQDYDATVGATIDLSLDSLPQAGRDLIILLSRFDASLIAQNIIVKSAERQFRHIGRGVEGDVLDPQTIGQADALMAIFCPSGKWLESEFNDIIEHCLQYSLLQVTTRGEVRFYSMHVLVQAYLQSNSASIRHHQVEQLAIRLLGSAVTIEDDYKYYEFDRMLVPHLKLVAIDHVAEAGDYFAFGRVLQEQGNARLSSEHFERGLALRRSGLGDEDLETAMMMSYFASSYSDLGRYQEALEVGLEVLDLQKRISGDPGTVLAMGNLALSYRDLGRHQEALEFGLEVLGLQKRVSGDEHPDTVLAMGNLALSYRDLGRYREALELEVEVLDMQKRISGDEHPDTVRAMANLAMSYRGLGRYQEALELGVEVLDLQKQILGDEHPDTVLAMGNLALSYRDLGRYQEALELGLEVLDLQKRILGDEHPDTVLAMDNLASSYSDLERHQEALELGLEVLDLRKRISGDEHPGTVRAMTNLPILYRGLGRHQEALELGLEVLDLRKRVSGDEHPDTVLAMGDLASSYSDLGRHQEALELGLEVLDLRKRILGDEHPHTVRAMANLAMSYSELGRYQEALKLEVEVLDMQKRISGDEHPDTVCAMSNLASSYHDLGRHREAVKLQEEVLVMHIQLLGEDHPKTLRSMWSLSLTLHELGNKERAIALLQAAVPLQEEALGMEHTDTVAMKEQLDDFLETE